MRYPYDNKYNTCSTLCQGILAKYYYNYEAILEPANYDGRKDTQFKGSIKYNDETLARVGGERWPNKLRGFKEKEQINNPQHHGNSIESYGISGAGFSGHSGNYDAEGNLLTYKKDGVPARNKRDVWWINTQPFKESHFAVFPEKLIEPCILAGSKKGDMILDPFCGSGTTGVVCIKHEREFIGIELNPEYIKIAENRIAKEKQQMKLEI